MGGHADSRGSDAYNRDLSQRRALAVRRFLMEQGRVRRIQLAARGYGESRPATSERNRREYQANRRVEVRVINPEAMSRGSKVASRGAMETLAAQSARGARGTMLAAGQ